MTEDVDELIEMIERTDNESNNHNVLVTSDVISDDEDMIDDYEETFDDPAIVYDELLDFI